MRPLGSSLVIGLTVAVFFALLTSSLAKALDVGSAGPTPSGITVNVHRLRILALQFQDNVPTDKTGQQVDVFSGGTNPTYRIYARIKDTRGWGAVTQVDFQGWYKNGNVAALFGSTPGANNNFQVRWTPAGGFVLITPLTGEVTLGAGIDTAIDANTHDLSARFTFGNQVHRGDGTGAFSWGFGVTATDTFQTASATGEFGIYRYVSMTVAGSPVGTGDPGTTVSLAPDNNVAFTTNSNFYLEVAATDLLDGLGNTITRDNILVNGATGSGAPDLTVFTAFTVVDGTIDVYGHYNDNVGPTTHASYASGNSETGVVQVQVAIPIGQTEGTYTGTLTYRLWQSPLARP